MRARMTSTSKPAPKATALNTRSLQAPPALVLVSREATVGVTAAMDGNLRRDLNLTQLRLRLLLQRRRECRVQRVGREFLSVADDVGQEALERIALGLVGLLLVHDDPRR